MNANDVNPAVISVIEEPINGFGTSAQVILSRMAEMILALEKNL